MSRTSQAAPVKVLYLMDMLRWGPDAGGTEKQFMALLAHLDRERIQPHIAVFRAGRAVPDVERLSCSFRVLGIPKLLHIDGLRKLSRLALRIRAERFQVVHIFLSEASIAAPPFCRAGGARVVVSRRDMGFWYTPGALRALRVSNAFVSRMIANSEAVRENVGRRERFPLSKTDVIPNGHDPGIFEAAPDPRLREALGIGPSDPIVGMVANFHPWKRHGDLVKAFADVRAVSPRARLLLVGSGDAGPARAAAAEAGVADAVHILSNISNVIPIVKHFDVAVLSSETEGSSNALIEYMGCARPIVCTRVGGNVELICHDDNGLVVAARDAASLAGGILHLLANPDAAARLGERARASAMELTIKAMAERHMCVYEAIAGPQAENHRWPSWMSGSADPRRAPVSR